MSMSQFWFTRVRIARAVDVHPSLEAQHVSLAELWFHGKGELRIVADEQGRPAYSRRRLLAAGAFGVAGLTAAPVWARNSFDWGDRQLSWTRPKLAVERSLSFRHRHTDERLNTVYYANGRYIPSALKDVDWLLRDFRSDEVKEIDERLLDLLYAVRQRLETDEAFEIYSGYRTPETNALLRQGRMGCRSQQPAHAGDGGGHRSSRLGVSRYRQLRPGPAARRRRLLRPSQLRPSGRG